MSEGPFQNTDREIWSARPGDYYADSIHVTDSGSIGINVGGHVVVMPAREWHALAQKKFPLDPNGKLWIGYCDLCNGQHCLQMLAFDATVERAPHRYASNASAPTAPSEALPEIERLKAENASLRNDLGEARSDAAKLPMARKQRAAAEQRAEAAEKEHRLCTGKLIAAAGRIAYAEEASAMADRAHAIAQTLPGRTADSPVERLNLELQALTAALHSWSRAALHDEERRQTMEVTREVVKEAFGENRPQVLDRAGEQGAEPGARTGADRLVDAARDRPPDQALGGSGRCVSAQVLDERTTGLDEERSAPGRAEPK